MTATMTASRPSRRPILVDSVMAALHLRRAYNATVKPATIRQWAARKHISNHGYGQRRYDLREVVAEARKRGLIAD